METRKKRGEDLHTALEDAKTRLHVIEAEASLWKDTTFIVSEHVVFYDRAVSVKRFTGGFI